MGTSSRNKRQRVCRAIGSANAMKVTRVNVPRTNSTESAWICWLLMLYIFELERNHKSRSFVHCLMLLVRTCGTQKAQVQGQQPRQNWKTSELEMYGRCARRLGGLKLDTAWGWEPVCRPHNLSHTEWMNKSQSRNEKSLPSKNDSSKKVTRSMRNTKAGLFSIPQELFYQLIQKIKLKRAPLPIKESNT